MDERKSDDNQWRWRYSMLGGVMYGPIPVGLIVVAILAVIYLIATANK